MTQIRRQIDRLIVRLTQQDAFSGVRFVREYGKERIETPVGGMLAVVGVTAMTRERGYLGGLISSSERGERCAANAEICVYAPPDENGSGLSELVSRLMTGLELADREKLITDMRASAIEFDPNLNIIFRRVEFRIESCLCGEGKDDPFI